MGILHTLTRSRHRQSKKRRLQLWIHEEYQIEPGEIPVGTAHNRHRDSLANDHKNEITAIVASAFEREDVKQWFLPYMQIFTLGGGIGFAAGMTTKKMGAAVF